MRVRTIHGSPPQTPGTLSMPGKASPKSCTTHWSSCAFSARLIAARSFSASCRRVMTDSLSCRLLVGAPQYSLFRGVKRMPVKVLPCCPCPLRQLVEQCPGLLPAGDVQGLLEPGFRLRLRRHRLPQEQDAPEARDFRFPKAFLMLLHQGVGLGQRLEAVFRVAQVVRDFRQHGAIVWDVLRCPGGPPGGDPLADLRQPLLTLALHGQDRKSVV